MCSAIRRTVGRFCFLQAQADLGGRRDSRALRHIVRDARGRHRPFRAQLPVATLAPHVKIAARAHSCCVTITAGKRELSVQPPHPLRDAHEALSISLTEQAVARAPARVDLAAGCPDERRTAPTAH
eukprot:scaffold36274_cov125-Isochrysis_galbana.AAC.14